MQKFKIVTRGPAMVESEYIVEAESEEDALKRARDVTPKITGIYWDSPEHAQLEWEDYSIVEVAE